MRPVATNDRAVVLVGCATWGVLLVACLVWDDRLAAAGRQWWLWTCVAGLVLGLAGLAFLHHRVVHHRAVQQQRRG